MKKEKIQNLALSGVFVVIIAVLSQIAIPIPTLGVPLTLQTFAVAFCGYFLALYYGVLSVFVYILIGLIGVPVFANFGVGVATLFGFSGGFIFGFLPLCFFCSLSRYFKNEFNKIIFGIIGLLICHFFGVLQFSFITKSGMIHSFLVVSLPYIIKDVLSVIIAFLFSKKIKKILKTR